MKRFAYFLLFLCSCNSKKTELDGAYLLLVTKYNDATSVKEDTAKQKTIKVIRGGYWISATFSGNKKVTVESAIGGTYKVKHDQYIETISFSSQDESLIGKVYSYNYKFDNGRYTFNKFPENTKCKNCLIQEDYVRTEPDNKLKDPSLEGVWKLQTSEWFGKKVEDRDLVLYKIYIYPRFAWASYHAKGKDFIGTAGGTYHFNGKKLVENVEFFSYYVVEPYDFPADITKFSSDSIQQISMDGAGKEIYKKVK